LRKKKNEYTEQVNKRITIREKHIRSLVKPLKFNLIWLSVL
jgi:hypothetical protein